MVLAVGGGSGAGTTAAGASAGGGGGGGGGGGVGGGTEPLRNGRRSRPASPNGHATPDSSSDDDNVVPVPAEKIRVGRDYQAVCPELEPMEERQPELIADRALLVWSPTLDIADNKLDEYITVAKEKYGYNGEQALGMLFWHKHDLDRAVLDLANFTPFPDEWTFEDKVLFEQAFNFHGKSFHRIRQMLPDKSIASLVKYYYSWKKTRARTSQMDRSVAVQKRDGSPDHISDRASDERESDADEKKWTVHRGIRRGSGSPPPNSQSSQSGATDASQPVGPQVGEGSGEGWCTACGILCNKMMPHNAHKLCSACHAHARRTGSLRPVCGPVSRRGGPKQARFKHKLPRGIYINHDDLVAMATESVSSMQSNISPSDGNNVNNNGAVLSHHQQPLNQGDFILKAMDREIISLKRQVQINKQQISALKRKNSDSIDDLRPGEIVSKISSRWTGEELLLAVQGVRKYGKDFQAIAETIGSKTENHMRTFWASYRRRFNLDAILREWEAERGGGTSGSSSIGLSTTPVGNVSNDNASNQDTNNVNGEDDSEINGNNSTTGASGSATARSNSPVVIKDDKMEVDSEGCALGSIAEQGGAPTTPSKPATKSSK